MSVDEVIDRLGEPISRVPEGRNEDLNYGTWQIGFTHDRMALRSTDIVLRGDRRRLPRKKLIAAVSGLSLGAKIGSVRAQLGGPVGGYETLEGQGDRVIVLRYQPWELIFVNGRLDQRTR